MNLPADPAAQQGDADPAPDDPTPTTAPTPVDRRLLDAVFGEVLPETTSDERAERDDRGHRPGTGDEWFYENRPPHHDR